MFVIQPTRDGEVGREADHPQGPVLEGCLVICPWSRRLAGRLQFTSEFTKQLP